MFAVEGQAARRLARRQRRALLHDGLLRIDDGDFAGVLDVDEDACAVGLRELRLAGEVDRRHDRAVGGVENRRVLAAAVEGEEALRARLVQERLRKNLIQSILLAFGSAPIFLESGQAGRVCQQMTNSYLAAPFLLWPAGPLRQVARYRGVQIERNRKVPFRELGHERCRGNDFG